MSITLDFDPRPQQTEILEFTKASINNGTKAIMIDAPTGVGKSYAAIMISDWYTTNINKSAKVDILTNSKILQDQYLSDFKFIKNLKGKNNYWCNRHNTTCGNASLISKATKQYCRRCPYTFAKSGWVNSQIGITNFHLITTYSMYSPDLLESRGGNLLIIDEAHDFENIFCSFISSVLSKNIFKKLEIWEDWIEDDLHKIKNINECSDYLKSVILPKLNNLISANLNRVTTLTSRKKKLDLLNKINYADSIVCKFNRFINDQANYLTNWVFEKDLDQNGNTRIKIEPIWGSIYLNDQFWSKYDHIIFMSGTILNSEFFSKLMGISNLKTSYLSLDCPFDPKNRPIIYARLGKMNYSNKEKTFKRLVPLIERILKKNKENKGIVHTSNYELSNWIKDSIKDSRLLFHTSIDRDKQLAKHIRSQYNTVLISPSMITGIDLKDNLSRFQILLKVPFPNLNSNKIKKRLETNPEWYQWKTLVDLLQAYGRSIRSNDDWAETYILDQCFDQLLEKLPKYFKDALKIK